MKLQPELNQAISAAVSSKDCYCSNHVKMFHICCCLEAKNQAACCSVTLSTTIHNNVLCSTATAWFSHRCTKIF